MSLKPKQRAQLRALAHPLKPVLYIGKDGVTDAALNSLRDAFGARELLKVKIQGAAPLTAAEAGTEIAGHFSDIHHVQTIGRTIVLYRPHHEKPEIRLDV